MRLANKDRYILYIRVYQIISERMITRVEAQIKVIIHSGFSRIIKIVGKKYMVGTYIKRLLLKCTKIKISLR